MPEDLPLFTFHQSTYAHREHSLRALNRTLMEMYNNVVEGA